MKTNENILALAAPSDFENMAAMEWKQATLDRLPAEVTLVEVDMAGIRTMDSSGLTALLALNEALVERKGSLRLINPSTVVTQLLELTRLHRVLAISNRSSASQSPALRPILVVEDEAIIRTVAKMSLSPLGREIIFAENGQEALEMAGRCHPAVILLDYLMPLMDGTETLRQLKMDAATKDIPVIIMSANERIAKGAYEGFEGAAGFISKPFSPAKLRSEVHQIIQGLEVAA